VKEQTGGDEVSRFGNLCCAKQQTVVVCVYVCVSKLVWCLRSGIVTLAGWTEKLVSVCSVFGGGNKSSGPSDETVGLRDE